MSLKERVTFFDNLFILLTSTTSRNMKELIVKREMSKHPEYEEDWKYILETLDGKHPIGWTFQARYTDRNFIHFTTIKNCIIYLEKCPKTNDSTYGAECLMGKYGIFLEPIVNRTLRLGIGKSLLPKTDLTPMLAKKYEPSKYYSYRDLIVITEKLDGNRCIASYVDGEWKFTSRSGKPLNVNIDMSGLPLDYIYDGELMSVQQTQRSMARTNYINAGVTFKNFGSQLYDQQLFNQTSGLVNRKGEKSGLVYNIFDIVNNESYEDRRALLMNITKTCALGNEVRILPVLYIGRFTEDIDLLLDNMVNMGGEGLMINFLDRGYEHKRSDALLKYKRVQTIDMFVYSFEYGKGKYEGMVGALNCRITKEDGSIITCQVGTGISDAEREEWAINPNLIVNKFVEIGYHEITQNKDFVNSNIFSLRFPRFIRIRNDKNSTSEY